jgi:hypothetical protein
MGGKGPRLVARVMSGPSSALSMTWERDGNFELIAYGMFQGLCLFFFQVSEMVNLHESLRCTKRLQVE